MPGWSDIYEVTIGGGEHPTRPGIIVSRDSLNREDDLLVVPFTSVKVAQRRNLDRYVYFAQGECNLREESVAQGHKVTFLDKKLIDFSRGRIGKVPRTKMQEIVYAIRWAVLDETL